MLQQVPAPAVLPQQLQPIPLLEQRAAMLRNQLIVLNADRHGTITRMRMTRGGDQMGLRAHMIEVNAQIAQTTGDLESVRAQIAMRQGKPVTSELPPPIRYTSRQLDPNLISTLGVTLAIAVLMPLSIAWARRLWVRAPTRSIPMDADVATARFDRLEQAVESIAIEVERISEGQRFVTKVLAGQPAVDQAGIRALGAGPIEAIRVPDRQAVRQSVTPH